MFEIGRECKNDPYGLGENVVRGLVSSAYRMVRERCGHAIAGHIIPQDASQKMQRAINDINLKGWLEGQAVEQVRDEFLVREDQLGIVAELLLPDQIRGEAGYLFETPERQRNRRNRTDVPSEEIQKRRLINAFIQGGAHGAQYRFFLIEGLEEELIAACKVIMALGDIGLFLNYSEDAPLNTPEVYPDLVAGLSKLDFSTTPPTVRASAVFLPILIHEIAKGVLEYVALHGLPEDENLRRAVLQKADSPQHEVQDIRVGITLWKKYIEIVRDREERMHIFKQLVSLPANEFLRCVRILASKDKNKVQNFMRMLNMD